MNGTTKVSLFLFFLFFFCLNNLEIIESHHNCLLFTMQERQPKKPNQKSVEKYLTFTTIEFTANIVPFPFYTLLFSHLPAAPHSLTIKVLVVSRKNMLTVPSIPDNMHYFSSCRCPVVTSFPCFLFPPLLCSFESVSKVPEAF